MPRITGDDKRARKERIVLHLAKYPDGLKVSELVEHLRYKRETLRDYLAELEAEGHVYKDGQRWIADDYHYITLRPLHASPEEAMVLYLAARLFVKQSDKRVITAENVLSKLAGMLQADADVSADIVQAAQELAHRPIEKGYEDTFRTVVHGYLYRQSVEIDYHPYRGPAFRTTIQPYLIEPSAIGFSTYVIGHSSNVDALRTYKIERIQSARILHAQAYFIPPDFPGLKLLQNAWSIFYGDETTVVVLRFNPDVARRVRETFWHPSQQPVTADPDKPGYVRLQFEVADTTDLTPWIRTWGANCEVLQPDTLRDAMIGEARRFAELYGWQIGGGSMSRKDRFNSIFGD